MWTFIRCLVSGYCMTLSHSVCFCSFQRCFLLPSPTKTPGSLILKRYDLFLVVQFRLPGLRVVVPGNSNAVTKRSASVKSVSQAQDVFLNQTKLKKIKFNNTDKRFVF